MKIFVLKVVHEESQYFTIISVCVFTLFFRGLVVKRKGFFLVRIQKGMMSDFCVDEEEEKG